MRATLVAIARLTAAWTENAALAATLTRLPERLDAALHCDWSAGLSELGGDAGAGAYVVGRGPGLAIAQEAALKLKETSYLHAEGISSAEIRHGPRAVVDRRFPVLAFGLDDLGGADTKAFAAELAEAGAPVLLASPVPKWGGRASAASAAAASFARSDPGGARLLPQRATEGDQDDLTKMGCPLTQDGSARVHATTEAIYASENHPRKTSRYQSMTPGMTGVFKLISTLLTDNGISRPYRCWID